MNKRSRYFRLGMTAFLVVAASLLFYFLLFKTSSLASGIRTVIRVLNPVVYGFAIAYMLNPVMTLIEKAILKIYTLQKSRPGRRMRSAIRMFATFCSLGLVILLVYTLFSRILPELYDSITGIINSLPTYISTVVEWMDNLLANQNNEYFTVEESAIIDFFNSYSDRLMAWLNNTAAPNLEDIMTKLTSSVWQIVVFFKNLFIGMIVSLYVLIYKDTIKARIKRVIYCLTNITTGNQILHNLRFVDRKFGGFLIGKLIDSAIIGVICYVCMALLSMPYPMLVSIFIGLTNVIPFFGPFIGAVPSVILIFFVEPIQALYFIILILVLQQFDGNFLGPKILGNSVGISSFMVLVSITICGGFFGIFGMIIGVPLFAVISAVGQEWIIKLSIKKKIPGDVNDYRELWKIDPETRKSVTDRTPRSRISLYEAIKYQSRDMRECSYDINTKPWDKTVDSVRREIEYSEWSRRMETCDPVEETEDFVSSNPKLHRDAETSEEHI